MMKAILVFMVLFSVSLQGSEQGDNDYIWIDIEIQQTPLIQTREEPQDPTPQETHEETVLTNLVKSIRDWVMKGIELLLENPPEGPIEFEYNPHGYP